MPSEPNNQPESKPANRNKKFFLGLVEEIHFGKLLRDFLIGEKKGLTEGWAVILVIALIFMYGGYEHGTHSNDDNIKKLDNTIGNQQSIIQSNYTAYQYLNQKIQDKDVEIQKLIAERDKAQIEADIANNALASWKVLAQSSNTNTPLTERLDVLTKWVAKNTDSLTNVFNNTTDNGKTFDVTVNGQRLVEGYDKNMIPNGISLFKSKDIFIQVYNKMNFEIDKLSVTFTCPLKQTDINLSGTWTQPIPQGSNSVVGEMIGFKIISIDPMVGNSTFNTTTFSISTNVNRLLFPAQIRIDALGRKQQSYFVMFALTKGIYDTGTQ